MSTKVRLKYWIFYIKKLALLTSFAPNKKLTHCFSFIYTYTLLTPRFMEDISIMAYLPSISTLWLSILLSSWFYFL